MLGRCPRLWKPLRAEEPEGFKAPSRVQGGQARVSHWQGLALTLSSPGPLFSVIGDYRPGDQPKEFPLMAATDVTREPAIPATESRSLGRTARRLATETKQAFTTTEFWAMVGLVVAILVSAAAIKGG